MKKRVIIFGMLGLYLPCYAPYEEPVEQRQEEKQQQTKYREIEEEKRQKQLEQEKIAAEEERKQEEEKIRLQQEHQKLVSTAKTKTRKPQQQSAFDDYKTVFKQQQELKYEYVQLQEKILQLEKELVTETNPTMIEAFEKALYDKDKLADPLKLVTVQLAAELKKIQQGTGFFSVLSTADVNEVQQEYAATPQGKEIFSTIQKTEQNIQQLMRDIATAKSAAKRTKIEQIYLPGHDFVKHVGNGLSSGIMIQDMQDIIDAMDPVTQFSVKRKIPQVLVELDKQIGIEKNNIDHDVTLLGLCKQIGKIIVSIMRFISRAPETIVGPYLPQLSKGGELFGRGITTAAEIVDQSNNRHQQELNNLQKQRQFLVTLQKQLS